LHEKFRDNLSARSKNGIARCFGRQVLDTTPEVIAAAGPARLRMTNQVGHKTLQEIARLLFEFGYIECPYKWLGSYDSRGYVDSKKQFQKSTC